MSPLLFSLYISGIGEELNSSGLGIDLQDVNISAILFADDLVLLGKSRNALDLLMEKTRRFFHRHKLDLSESKSKINVLSSYPFLSIRNFLSYNFV